LSDAGEEMERMRAARFKSQGHMRFDSHARIRSLRAELAAAAAAGGKPLSFAALPSHGAPADTHDETSMCSTSNGTGISAGSVRPSLRNSINLVSQLEKLAEEDSD